MRCRWVKTELMPFRLLVSDSSKGSASQKSAVFSGFERSWQVLGASLGRLPTIPLVAGPNFPLITRYRNHPFVSLKSGLFSIKQCKLTEIYSLLTILIVLRVLVRHGLI